MVVKQVAVASVSSVSVSWPACALGACLSLGAAALGCSSRSAAPAPRAIADASAPPPPPPVIVATSRSTRFVVREHMIASIEMQLSGEPFAVAMGRDPSRYSRAYRPPNVYFDPAPGAAPRTDLAGFSSAIESTEYAKQPMNDLAFESGAGASLAFAPLLNPSGNAANGCAALRASVQQLGAESGATGRPYFSSTASTANPLGWPGMWPTVEPFESFDPAIDPTNAVAESCSITGDDDPGADAPLMSDDYECDATTLHLRDRASQIDATLSPGAAGWAAWKAALGVMSDLRAMHDLAGTQVSRVQPGFDESLVGQPDNGAIGAEPGALAGTYLGSGPVEGLQAGVMITAFDNAAADWLFHRSTVDGTKLTGFPDLGTALAYDSTAPLRWFPAETAVTETTAAGCAFPRAAAGTITDATSSLLDLAGLVGAYATAYALTDRANPLAGGSQPCLVYFDGDPFPLDDGLADGEPTLHDRALGVLRVALVDLQRMHVDPVSGLPADRATVTITGDRDAGTAAGVATHGATLQATSAAYTLLSLRTARLSLTGRLALAPSDAIDPPAPATILDSPPILVPPEGTAADGPTTIAAALNQDIAALAALFYDGLTDASGRAWPAWDLVARAPTGDPNQLDAHTAAIRGLVIGFAATGDVRYRERAMAVFRRVESAFWDPAARVYRDVAGASGAITYTALRFGLVQAMLRDVYELTASVDGATAIAPLVEQRVARVNKLVLDGWDDRNDDGQVDYPDECILPVAGATSPGGGVAQGGLQMAERALTGETGSVAAEFDAGPRVVARDRQPNCVPEISVAHLPAALADSITLQVQAMSAP
jgi:hypothetical protein